MAAMGIGDEILKWLRSQDPPCPWDYSTPDAAAFSGNVFALEYAVENGCDFDPDACMDEAEENDDGSEGYEWVMTFLDKYL